MTREAIIINGKRLRPTEFRGFDQGPFPGTNPPEHGMGYHYGAQYYGLPGVWEPNQAMEIVLALNLRFRLFHGSATQVDQGNAQQLRDTRPTDF